jgi:hypothetical protein
MIVELHYPISLNAKQAAQYFWTYHKTVFPLPAVSFRQLARILEGASLTYAIDPEKRLLTLQPILILFTP